MQTDCPGIKVGRSKSWAQILGHKFMIRHAAVNSPPDTSRSWQLHSCMHALVQKYTASCPWTAALPSQPYCTASHEARCRWTKVTAGAAAGCPGSSSPWPSERRCAHLPGEAARATPHSPSLALLKTFPTPPARIASSLSPVRFSACSL